MSTTVPGEWSALLALKDALTRINGAPDYHHNIHGRVYLDGVPAGEQPPAPYMAVGEMAGEDRGQERALGVELSIVGPVEPHDSTRIVLELLEDVRKAIYFWPSCVIPAPSLEQYAITPRATGSTYARVTQQLTFALPWEEY